MIAASPRSVGAARPARPRRLQRPRNPDIRRGRPASPVYVGRPTLWTNPFRSERFGHARAVGLHRAWLAGRLGYRTLLRLGFNDREIMALHRLRERVLNRLGRLAGADIECWCAAKSRWCHGDTLIALANGQTV